MEFPFDLAACIGAERGFEGPCVGYVDEKALRSSSGGALSTVLEELGRKSATAQGLRKPVTYGSAHGMGDQRVYLLVQGRTALGILKVGRKRLFVAAPPVESLRRGADVFADVQGAFREIEPLCCLDFYVHERCQRSGFGRQLFETMLARERTTPEQLGYDRPSPKLMGFLKKHCGLGRYQPQNNNFVVFDAFFDPSAEQGGEARSTSRCAASSKGVSHGHGGYGRAGASSGAIAGSSTCRLSAARDAERLPPTASGAGGRGGPRDLFGGGADHPLDHYRRAAPPIF